MNRPFTPRLLALASLLALALAPRPAAAQVHGAGATFPEPIYRQWFAGFLKATGVSVDYQAVGSGQGVKSVHDKTVDFGASDAPLSAKEEADMPGPVVHIPTVGGAVVLTYELPGVASGLRLTPDVIADIFLGKIKNWSDPRIRGINPGVNLPNLNMLTVHRSDGSGTTYIFTHYLRKVSPAWASGPGAGKSVEWPTGLAGKGNAGVAANIKRTPGAVGYVELAYAVENKLPYASVKNRAGNFIKPSSESTTAAISQYVNELKKDIKTPTVDAAGANSYPICSLTYILLYRTGGSNVAQAVKLWSWVMQPAQQAQAKTLLYAPLPSALTKLNLANLATIK